MDCRTRHTILLIFSFTVFISCASSKEKDVEISKAAADVAEAASSELSLSQRQKVWLEDAVYSMYEAIEIGTEDLTDPSEIAEVRRNAHTEFRHRLEGQFRNPKTTEILAWYYNYCNGKNKYETEY